MFLKFFRSKKEKKKEVGMLEDRIIFQINYMEYLIKKAKTEEEKKNYQKQIAGLQELIKRIHDEPEIEENYKSLKKGESKNGIFM